MPTFKEKCPKFGQKINVDGEGSNGFFVREERNVFVVQHEKQIRYYSGKEEWISVSEEPQWTQITEDESTWPMLGQHFLLGNQSDLPSVQFYRSIDGIFYDETIFQSPKIKVCELIGRMWLPLPVPPKRKKEEKPYISDESIEQLKRAETEARLWKLERKADEFSKQLELISGLKLRYKEESSPWIPVEMLVPNHGNEVLVRSKLSTGDFIYGIGCIFKGDWRWSNCARPEEWMEIPK